VWQLAEHYSSPTSQGIFKEVKLNMAKRKKKYEARLFIPRNRQRVTLEEESSEIELVKSLSKAEQNKIVKDCLADLKMIELKREKKLKLPQFKTKEGKERLERQIGRFINRRKEILKSLNVSI
jgi:hypothetical protein